jgi:hypothetical protein
MVAQKQNGGKRYQDLSKGSNAFNVTKPETFSLPQMLSGS